MLYVSGSDSKSAAGTRDGETEGSHGHATAGGWSENTQGGTDNSVHVICMYCIYMDKVVYQSLLQFHNLKPIKL